MAKSSAMLSQLQPVAVAIPHQRLWPRLREAGAAWMHRLVEAQRGAVRAGMSSNIRFDDDMPAEFGRLPRRLWQRHSAYLVYGRNARSFGPEPEVAQADHDGDAEAISRSA